MNLVNLKKNKKYNPKKAKKRYEIIRDDNIRKILEYYNVEFLSCKKCNATNKYFGFFDFHHIDPSKKESSISSMMGHKNWEKMETELSKCEVLCPNCHRQHHLKEQENDRKEINEREVFEVNIL